MFPAIVGQSWADDAHPFSLEVNGVDVIAMADFRTIRVEMAGPGSNGSLSFTISDPTAAITVGEWDEVRFIEHAATRPILFGGFVQSARTRPWATAGRQIEIICVGYGILLDRKVVETFTIGTANVGLSIVSLINRHGGRISGTAVGDGGRNTYASSATGSVTYVSDWRWTTGLTFPDVAEPATLRGVLDAWSDASTDYAYPSPWKTSVLPARPMTYWVDGAARLHAHPNLDEANGSANTNWDGTCSVAISESTGGGLVQAADFDYEVENTDLLTRVWVKGADATGSGWVTQAGLERAGDLEGIVDRADSTTVALRDAAGDGVITTTRLSDVRATVWIDSTTTLDIRPGQKLAVSSTPLGLSSATFRITGVGITWDSISARRYGVTFGGQLGAPSAVQRSGRHSVRQRH